MGKISVEDRGKVVQLGKSMEVKTWNCWANLVLDRESEIGTR